VGRARAKAGLGGFLEPGNVEEDAAAREAFAKAQAMWEAQGRGMYALHEHVRRPIGIVAGVAGVPKSCHICVIRSKPACFTRLIPMLPNNDMPSNGRDECLTKFMPATHSALTGSHSMIALMQDHVEVSIAANSAAALMQGMEPSSADALMRCCTASG